MHFPTPVTIQMSFRKLKTLQASENRNHLNHLFFQKQWTAVQTANVRLGQSVFSDESSHAERRVYPQTHNSTRSCAPPKSSQQQRRSVLMTCLLLGRRALASSLSQASENSFSVSSSWRCNQHWRRKKRKQSGKNSNRSI